MATMQEYLEEMARRQAAGWTPGVPNRYLGALPTSYTPFSNLGALWSGDDTGPSSYAQRALDIQAEMASARNAALGGSKMYVGGSSPTELALTLNPADQAYVYGPSDAAARARYTSGVAHDPTVRTVTDPVEQELVLMERRRQKTGQGPIPTPLSQAKTVKSNWVGETVPMDQFLAQQGSVQSGIRDAHYMQDGTIRNSAGEIIDVPADVVPTKANVEEIAAKSETPADVERRLAAEKTQALSTRKGTGLVKSLGPVLGTGLAAALAPEDVWANPLSQSGLQYGLESATGINPAGLVADPRAYAPFSYSAAGDIVSGVGQGIVAGLDTSQVGIDLEQDYGMGGGVMPFEGARLGARAGPDLPQSYDLSGQIPSQAGRMTGMPVAMDAGGAVGGYPAMDTAEDWMDPTILSAPASDAMRPSPSTLSVDSWSPNWGTMDDMYASTGNDSPWSGVRDMWSDYADKVSTPTTSSADQFAGLSFSDKKDILMDSVDKINKMGNAGMLPAPTDFSSPFMSLWSHPTMTSQNAAYSQGLKQQLAGDLFGSFLGGPAYAGYQFKDEGSKLIQDILSGKLGTQQQANAGLGGFLAQMAPALGIEDGTALATINDAWAAANVDDFSALANPNISVQDTIDTAYNENIGMGQVASHPGQGGYIGDTERTIGEHLAAANERVQAMPAVTTSQALSTQDERQQAMPTEVTKTKGPTKASVAAQARLAQQQADAAMRRAAQKAAAQDAARLAAQRAAVQADIAAAQAEQDRIRQAKALMNSKSYQESGMDGLSAAERDIVAAAQVDTFAGIERQIRGDSDTAGERSAGMGGGRGGFAGPDRW